MVSEFFTLFAFGFEAIYLPVFAHFAASPGVTRFLAFVLPGELPLNLKINNLAEKGSQFNNLKISILVSGYFVQVNYPLAGSVKTTC